MKPDCPQDPFRPRSGFKRLWYLFTREVPKEERGQWFPLGKSPDYISAICRADGTVRQRIIVQEGGIVQILI